MASFNEYMSGLSRQPAPRRQMLPLDQILGGVSGLNRSALRMADTLVGNPLAGLYNSLADSPIEANPMLRLAQQYGVGRDAINPQQAQAQALTGSVGDMAASMVPGAGDISGLAQDITAMAKDKIPVNPLTVGLAATGALPLVPPLLRMVPPRMWQNPGNDAMHGQAGALMYHGTPNTWAPEPGFPEGRPRFDSSTALTGEGVNAYGAGFYAAENLGVARSYQEALSGNRLLKDLPAESREQLRAVAETLPTINSQWGASVSPERAIKMIDRPDLQMTTEDFRRVVEDGLGRDVAKPKLTETGAYGSVYQFDFPDEMMGQFLDLDAPMKDQPWIMKEPAEDIIARVRSEGRKPTLIEMASVNVQSKAPSQTWAEKPGRVFLHELEQKAGGPMEALERLLNDNILGSKFLDADSRHVAGQGTSNYVLFKPQDFVKDVKKL